MVGLRPGEAVKRREADAVEVVVEVEEGVRFMVMLHRRKAKGELGRKGAREREREREQRR